MRSDHKRMRREEVYRNDNFLPAALRGGGRLLSRLAESMACAPLWVCRIRRKVAHLIKRTQRQQGLMAHQQQRRSCQRHPSDRRSSWLITMLKCDGSVWTESCEIRTEAIARRLFRMELRSIRNAANCLRPMQRDADHAFVVRHSIGGGTVAADTTSGQRRFLSAGPFPY